MESRIEAPALDAVTSERATSVRWRIFGVVFLITLINLVDRISLSIAMPTIAKEYALSPAMQGLILSSFFWSYALLQIPGGWLIDRYGPRKIIAGATVLWGIFQTLMVLPAAVCRCCSCVWVWAAPKHRSFPPAASSMHCGSRRKSAVAAPY